MTSLRNLTALIVDPHPAMRSNMQNMLNACGVTKIEHAVSSSTAIRPLKNRPCDLILCEYDLGEGQDGQQLLEDLRHNKLIPLWTIFIIVTAERAYEKVMGAAELTPNDYILKPFTADKLLERIGRAIERRAVFLPAYQAVEQGDLRRAIDLCRAGEAGNARYILDFIRLRAELHIELGEPEAAEQLYRNLVDAKPLAWARFGLAKSLFMQQRFDEARLLLTALVAENNRFMDAYDWLAKTHEATGQLSDAKSVLADAAAISPHAVRRLRRLGEIALEVGDVDTAERSFQKVVGKAKYSEFRDPEDHVRLVRTLVKKGDVKQAATVVRDLEKSMAGLQKTPVCKALSAALVHEQQGNAEQAAAELSAAVAGCRDTAGLSNELKMELAKNCLQHKLEDGASEVMRDVMSNAADDAAMARAMSVFEQAGRPDLAQAVAGESQRQVVELVSTGVEKARQGDYQGAVELMTAAMNKLPNNPQVAFNAALAVLKYLENNGWDGNLGRQARDYVDAARKLDPANPRLVPLVELHQAIMRKYGVGGRMEKVSAVQ